MFPKRSPSPVASRRRGDPTLRDVFVRFPAMASRRGEAAPFFFSSVQRRVRHVDKAFPCRLPPQGCPLPGP